MKKNILPLMALLFAVGGRLWASPEESQLAGQLASEAVEFLDDLLGPGRAKVMVSVHGEQSEVRTQSEVTTPIKRPGAAQAEPENNAALPGYVAKSELAPKKKEREEADYFQKDQEQSLRTSGLIIKNIHASVVLDNTLSDTQVNAVRRLLPDFLRMEGDRGDVLTILRAPLLPSWKRALLAPEGMRTLMVFGGIVFLSIWIGLMAYLIMVRVVRAFVVEMAARRAAMAAHLPPQAPLTGPAGQAARLGADILPGSLPTLTEPEVLGIEGARPVAALGRRFDFMSSREPSQIADLLAKEPPADLALMFGYLAESNPELAAQIFASLPAVLQGEASQSLMQTNMADPERLAMLESRLRTYVEYGVRGHERLGQILSRLPATEREEILGDLMSRDATAAQKVENALFPFESIAELPPVQLRRLIAAVPYREWGLALRGASEDVVSKILGEIPAGARAIARDAMAAAQPREKILEERSKILSQAFTLAARGQITLKRAGPAELI